MKNDMSLTLSHFESLLRTQLQAVEQAALSATELHDAECHIFQMTQNFGRHLLGYFLEKKGTGHQPQPPCEEDGRPMSYKGTTARTYMSIFGPLRIERAGYARPDGGMFFPLDTELNLPQGKHSYLLQNWIESGAVETDFHDAVGRLNHIFGFDLKPYVAQKISAEASEEAASFYDQKAGPEPDSEGSHLAFSADGKGIRILKSEREKDNPLPDAPKPRLGRGEKNGLKKQATVTVDFSFDPQPRQAQDIVKALLKKLTPDERKAVQQAGDNRRAKNKHIQATLAGKDVAMTAGMKRLMSRDPTGQKPIIALMDGDPHLEKAIRKAAKKAGIIHRIDAFILDIIHVSEYLWTAATALHGEKGNDRIKWVEKRLQAILEGKVGRVIGGLRQIITKNKPRKSVQKALNKTITYFDNHRHMMAYDQYLKKGYPIATGVVEGACGSFVKDRMEQSGMRWTMKGAQAVLKLRAVKKNNDWNEFWMFYTKQMKSKIYEN